MIYDFPRWVGSPHQSLVATQEAFDAFVRLFNGKAPCFTSHNAFRGPSVVQLRYVPHDLDAKNGNLVEALEDALSAREWARANDVSLTITFSGRKGFHLWFEFAPAFVRTNRSLKLAYEAFQGRVVEEAPLRTADRNVIGDTRRLLRIVNTQHEETKRWVVELPDEVLDQRSMDAVLDWADRPRPLVVRAEPTETFRSAAKRLKLVLKPVRGSDYDAPLVEYDERVVSPLMRELLPRPCVHQGLMSRNPPHLVRREAANQLVLLGYDPIWIARFLLDIGKKAEWLDLDEQVTGYHVHYLWRRKGKYSPHSCQTIRANGLCIGPKCKLYESVFGEVKT